MHVYMQEAYVHCSASLLFLFQNVTFVLLITCSLVRILLESLLFPATVVG